MSALAGFARAYAAHAGFPEPPRGFEAELAARLAAWPRWARAAAGPCAFAVRRLAPLALLGRAAAFESLTPEEKDELLERLQDARSPLLRGAFLLAKAPVLAACFGPRAEGV